ncbi:hypothetical protein AKJ58_01600 [candidate division MSBL1 archaeon SCGC-AAA385D11]|uniref:AAA+ ATPase domain-containing protein n=1 Tax=candidate division MSBL1 archaeon SCGC-AAA385D11 TaxID=1698286 RepID=A0A133VN77_9EURY|nr:hypothetical protein AKJ58_01600 [candidate division MSBL1 archaeon SCGC-AAA385D11]
MIRDARVLREYFIPRRILHREGQLEAIRDSLKPVLEGKSPRDMHLYGPPGSGKTCIARYLLEELSKRSSRIRTSYVNCFDNSSKFRVLYEVVRDIGSVLSVHEKGTPTDEVLERVRKLVEDRYCILVLDEVDKLRETDVLYSLARTPEIGLIFISNRETSLYRIDSRIRSSLACMQTLEFPEYSRGKLVDILKDRAKWGLMPESYREEQLERIAMFAEGDARLAIDSLRLAAERSEEGDHEEIQDEFIEGSVSKAKKEIDSKTLEKLNDDQLLLYRILKPEEELRAGELHEKYKEKAEDPVVDRTVRKYLGKLERLGLIETEGEGRWRVYKVRKE